MPAFGNASLGVIALGVLTAPCAFANQNFNALQMINLPMKGGSTTRYIPFTLRDVVSGAPTSGAMVTLSDGRMVNAYTYLRELNAIERELSSYGASLRSSDSDLGTVASARLPQPKLTSVHPDKNGANQSSTGWSHEISHTLAGAKAYGYMTQTLDSDALGQKSERTTSHTLQGRFLDANAPSIAQFVQRISRDENGLEQRETQVYINGRQVFRRGRGDSQEARIWKTAFDVPIKSVTIPVGPGSVDAKIGIRGGVNLDLEMNPSRGGNGLNQISLDFRPQILADAYVTGATTPTNVGDAGIEGAITLADDTLKIVGTAALSRAKFIDLRQIVVDNVFAGFNGRIAGYVNVKTPSRNAGDSDKKRFEKEFYKWDGIKVETRLYEYNADQQQPQPQLPAI